MKKISMVDDDSEAPNKIDKDLIDYNGLTILRQSFIDILIHTEVLLLHDDEIHLAKVMGQTKSDSGEDIEICNRNPLLSSIL